MCREEQVKTEEGEYFEMLLYTSSAGRLGMLVFARVKKAIFSLRAQRNVFNDVEFSDVLCSNKKVPHNCLGLFTAYNKERQRRFDLSFIIKPMSRLEEIMTSRERLWILEEQCCCPPEGLDLRDLFAALASDLVDILSCRPHHLLHPLLL